MDTEQFILWIRSVDDVAAALKGLRSKQQLTLQEVADLAGISKAYAVRLEHGKRFPERDTLIALLLAAFSLPVKQADRVLLLAGYAPMHHRTLAESRSL